MSRIISFPFGDQAVLVEVDSSDASKSVGIAKAGLASTIVDQVLQARQSLQETVTAALRANVQAFASAVTSLESAPTEWSVEFGLKMTGDFGNVVVAKLSAEANYSVKLTWKADTVTK